ncbi:MAG: UDP-glucose/GDP-mannose dehydrogenase family protein [Rikenellaceae bacterium]|nr:UDP-glucose/GDP-mannose dehydrogenase family protein [Rikenellaceae bacterium]
MSTKIAIVGTGYVGLVSGACFAEMGLDVVCVDVDKKKIENLRQGINPIYELGLDELLAKVIEAGRLSFSESLGEVIDRVEIIFSAVGTPPGDDGSADLRHVLEVAREVGRKMNSYKLVVTKSTVPVGTAARVRGAVQEELDKRGVSIPFDVASNPEFLKEGDAVKDFLNPDRVVIGVDSERAKELLTWLYRPLMLNNFRVIFMDILSAEMTKYAANAMLATRISFMNDIANLCELVGADVNMVRKGIGSDTRIGNKFLYPGAGYGGSCFPKDVKALIHTADEAGYELRVLKAVEEVNAAQKKLLYNKLSAYYGGDLKGRKIAMWGMAFKPETDDVREATSLVLAELITAAGATMSVYDPVAGGRFAEYTTVDPGLLTYVEDKYEALEDADALIMVTEWKEFRIPSWSVVKRMMKKPVVFDGRNIYDRRELEAQGIEYFNIGGK